MDRTIAKVIEGKRYSTATAELICSSSATEYSSDFRYEETALFRTPRGRFFLAGYGGPLSRWTRSVAEGQSGGEGLEPIKADEACSFAQEHADADIVAKFFKVEEA